MESEHFDDIKNAIGEIDQLEIAVVFPSPPGKANQGAQAHAADVSQIGAVQDHPAAVIFPARARGELSNIMAGWGTLTGEAHYTYSSNAHTNNAALRLGAFNWHGYSNPEMDRLIQAAAVELDTAKREQLLQEIGALFNRDRVSLPLAAVGTAWAMRRDRANLVRARTDEDTLAMDIAPAR